MDYDAFRALVHEALTQAGLMSVHFWPIEAIELPHMDRTYEVSMPVRDSEQPRPFHVTVRLSWVWDALQTARAAIGEEDLLFFVLGEKGHDMDTERPWMRLNVTLHATLPADAPLSMPDAGTWRRWMDGITNQVDRLGPTDLLNGSWESGQVLPAWQGHPVARLQCRPDGQQVLTDVEMAAWQVIELPRQWDDLGRPPDEETEAQLAIFFAWVYDTLQVWKDNLRHLVA